MGNKYVCGYYHQNYPFSNELTMFINVACIKWKFHCTETNIFANQAFYVSVNHFAAGNTLVCGFEYVKHNIFACYTEETFLQEVFSSNSVQKSRGNVSSVLQNQIINYTVSKDIFLISIDILSKDMFLSWNSEADVDFQGMISTLLQQVIAELESEESCSIYWCWTPFLFTFFYLYVVILCILILFFLLNKCILCHMWLVSESWLG